MSAAPNGLRVKKVVPVGNRTDKTATEAEGTLVILKNHVGHDAVVTTLPSLEICALIRVCEQPRKGTAVSVPVTNRSEKYFTIKIGDT